MMVLVFSSLILWKAVFASTIYPYLAYYDKRLELLFKDAFRLRSSDLILENEFINESHSSVDVKCINDLKRFKEGFSRSEMWALQMADSSGGLEPGIFSGNTINLGNYDECVRIVEDSITGSFCRVYLTFPNSTSQLGSNVPHNVPLIMALCAPTTCTADNLNVLLKSKMLELNVTMSVSCDHNSRPFDVYDYLAMLFFVLVLLIMIGSTIYDFHSTYNGPGNIWNSFSVIRNGKFLLKMDQGESGLNSLYGIRFISQVCVIWYHSFLVSLGNAYPFVNKFDLNHMLRTPVVNLSVMTVTVVDTFFVISGLLISYNFAKKGKSKIDVLSYYCHRLLRMSPVVIAVVILYATLGDQFCQGPLCTDVIGKERENCRKTWWSTVLYVNNFYPSLSQMCLVHTWYLSVDWQLFCASPLILPIIRKWPAKIYTSILALFVFISILISALITYFYGLSVDSMITSEPQDLEIYRNYYYEKPYIRAGPWLVGIALGVWLVHNKKSPIELNLKTQIGFWFITIFAMLISLTANLLLQDRGEETIIGATFFNALHPTIWGVSMAWIIFACSAGLGGPLNSLLSWSGFQPLSKLSYSAYLIHRLVVSLDGNLVRAPAYYTSFYQVSKLASLVVMSYLAAIIVYMSFEAPFGNLERYITNRGKHKRSSQKQNVSVGMNTRSS